MTGARRAPAGHDAHAARAIRAWSSAPPSSPFLALVGLLAPLLGTIDPSEIDPVYRNKKPGVERTIRGDDGKETRVHAPLRHRQLGRDIYSRVVYGARVSLIDRRHGGRAERRRRPRHRPGRRLPPLARRHHHARHGRPDGDPGDPARHRAGLAVARQPAWPW